MKKEKVTSKHFKASNESRTQKSRKKAQVVVSGDEDEQEDERFEMSLFDQDDSD